MTENDRLLLTQQLNILKECRNKWKTEMCVEEAKSYMELCLKEFFSNIKVYVKFSMRQDNDEKYATIIGETIADALIIKAVQILLKGDYE